MTRMVKIERRRYVAASPAALWEIIGDPDRFTEWYPTVESFEVLEGAGLGRRQRLFSTWNGRQAEIDQVVTAFEPGRTLAWRHEAERLDGRPAPVFARATHFTVRLAPEGPGTRVTLLAEIEPAGFLAGPLIRLVGARRVAGGMEQALAALHTVVRSGPPDASLMMAAD